MDTNVVLLTIDSLRYDRSEPEANLMPTLHRLAERGLDHRQAFSNGYSTPIAFPAIMTGTYPDQYGGTEYISDSRPFLARFLQERGYHTAAFHSNPHLRTDCNYDVGFDFYNDFDDSTDSASKLRYLVTQNLDSDSRLYSLLRRVYHFARTSSNSTDYVPAPEINRRAFEWLDTERREDQPFFLWTHYMDVHYPFYPPDEYVKAPGGGSISTTRKVRLNGLMHESPSELTAKDRADLTALYEGDIRYTDHCIAEFLDALEERGLLEETLFVVTSDHGELFGEYGRYGHPQQVSDEGLQVPLVFAGPGIPDGTTVTEQTSLVDLAPTLVSFLGFDTHPKWVGRDTTAFVNEADANGRRVVLGNHYVLACQTTGWRLIQWREIPSIHDTGKEWELWDRQSSVCVTLEDYPEEVTRLRESIDEYHEQVAETDETLPSAQVDAETTKQLEALGYR